MSVLEPEEKRPCVFSGRVCVTDRVFDVRRGGGDDGGADETRFFWIFSCRARNGEEFSEEAEETTKKR